MYQKKVLTHVRRAQPSNSLIQARPDGRLRLAIFFARLRREYLLRAPSARIPSSRAFGANTFFARLRREYLVAHCGEMTHS
jgi:hypothetical protein